MLLRIFGRLLPLTYLDTFAGTQLLLTMVDSLGNSGGVAPSLYSVVGTVFDLIVGFP